MSDAVAIIASIGSLLATIGAGVRWVRVQLDARDAEIRGELAACEAARATLEHRVAAVESAQDGGSFPRWVRDHEGRLLTVSDAFVRVVLARHGLAAVDVIGRRFNEIGLSEAFVDVLAGMDADLRDGVQFAIRRGVAVWPGGQRLTVIKTMQTAHGSPVYEAIAVPENQR